MALFENFPYTNLHQLNLDWLVAEMKKVEDAIKYGPVISVNGLTGEVVLYQEANVRLPDVMNPTQTNWNIFRYLNGHVYGIEFDATGNVYQIQDQYRRKLLTWADIPPESGVISVNGKYGVVRLYGSDIQTSGDDTKTVMESIYDLEDTDGKLQDAIDKLDTTVTGIQSSISTINNSIDDLDELTSTLQTISNAIKNSLAYVENTNIATHNLSSGTYVLWNNGAYKVKSGVNIAIGDTLSTSNLDPIGTKGFINDLNDSITALNSNITNQEITLASISSDLNNAVTPGIVMFSGSQVSGVSNVPVSKGGYVLVFKCKDNEVIQEYVTRRTEGIQNVFIRIKSGSTWSPWEELALNSKIGNFQLIEIGNISNKTLTFSFSGFCAIVVYGFGTAESRYFQTMIYGRSGGINPFSTLSDNTNITITGGDAAVTITSESSSATYVYMLVLAGRNNITWTVT